MKKHLINKQKDEIYSVICTSTSLQDFEILTLYERSDAMKVGKYFLGSLGGQFATISVVRLNGNYCLTVAFSKKLSILSQVAFCKTTYTWSSDWH